MRVKHRSRRKQQAFTLMELLLALGLSVVLLALIASAVNFSLNGMTVGRESVERARLASGIFEIMSADLRSTRIYQPQDTSAATEIAEEMADFDVDSIDSIGSETPSSSSSSSAGDSSSNSSGEAPPDSATIEARPMLGLNGTLDQLQVDVLRVPPDWQAMTTVVEPGMQQTIPTPPAASMATVTYGIANAGTTAQGGLARLESNRELFAYANYAGVAQSNEPLIVAPEVVAIEFRYFDGQQLLEYWDMTEFEALPQAVQITLWLETSADSSATSDGITTSSLDYTITVPLAGLENAINDQQESTDSDAAGEGT